MRERSIATKNALITAGLRLIASQGYHRTKVSDIVRAGHVTQGSFYWYFKSKLEMALEVIESGRREMIEVLKAGYRETPASVDDMIANSERLIRDLLAFARHNREFMLILLARGHGADPKIDEAIGRARQSVYEALRRNVTRATELGMLPEAGPIDQRAAFLHRLLEGSIEWWLFGNAYDLDHEPEVAPGELARRLARFEFFGLLDGSAKSGAAGDGESQ